jgi:hypothetical protein
MHATAKRRAQDSGAQLEVRVGDAVAPLRATLRHRFAESPVGDAARFARELETAFRSMWQRHCSSACARGTG